MMQVELVNDGPVTILVDSTQTVLMTGRYFALSALTRCTCSCCIVLLMLLLAPPALAQQRPLVTEDPETIGAGRVLRRSRLRLRARRRVSGVRARGAPAAGSRCSASASASARSPRCRSTAASTTGWRSPSARSGAAVAHADGDRRHDLRASRTSSIGDQDPPAVARARRGPPFGAPVRHQASRTRRTRAASGSTPWTSTRPLLVAKTVQSVRIVGNVGLGILGDPTRGDRQNDVLTYGLSFARALTTAAEVVGEVNGRMDTRDGDAAARHRIARHRPPRRPLHDRRLARRRGGAVRPDRRRPGIGVRRRLHLRLQRLPGALMLAAGCQGARLRQRLPAGAGGRRRAGRPPALARALCHRHHGIGADGLILYELRGQRRDDAAVERRRQPVGAFRQRPALPGGAGRPRAESRAGQRRSPVDTERRHEDARPAGPATASATTFRAAMGAPADLRQVQMPVARRDSARPRCCGWAIPQCVVLGPLPDRATASTGSGRRCRPTAMFPAGHQRRVRAGRGARPGADPDLGARRRSDHVVGHRVLGVGGGRRGARRRRRGRSTSWRPAAPSASSGATTACT